MSDESTNEPFLDEQDEDLVTFLRRNRPLPPEASPELEERILRACVPENGNQVVAPVATPRNPWKRWAGWGVAATLAAGAVLWMRAPSPVLLPKIQGTETPWISESDESEIGDFMVASWNAGLRNDGEEFDTLDLVLTE